MAIIELGGLSTPLVRIRRYDTSKQKIHQVSWRGPDVWDIGINNSFRLRFEFKKESIGNYFGARIWINKIDEDGNEIPKGNVY